MPECCEDVFRLAERYSIADLKQISLSFMAAQVDETNVVKMALIASKESSQVLLQVCPPADTRCPRLHFTPPPFLSGLRSLHCRPHRLRACKRRVEEAEEREDRAGQPTPRDDVARHRRLMKRRGGGGCVANSVLMISRLCPLQSPFGK